jgi:hypothetical protein
MISVFYILWTQKRYKDGSMAMTSSSFNINHPFITSIENQVSISRYPLASSLITRQSHTQVLSPSETIHTLLRLPRLPSKCTSSTKPCPPWRPLSSSHPPPQGSHTARSDRHGPIAPTATTSTNARPEAPPSSRPAVRVLPTARRRVFVSTRRPSPAASTGVITLRTNSSTLNCACLLLYWNMYIHCIEGWTEFVSVLDFIPCMIEVEIDRVVLLGLFLMLKSNHREFTSFLHTFQHCIPTFGLLSVNCTLP